MPTMEEVKELVNECTWTPDNYEGQYGYIVKGKNGRYIFIPVIRSNKEGYWSCSLKKEKPVYLYIYNTDTSLSRYAAISDYFSEKFYVRPVCTIQE